MGLGIFEPNTIAHVPGTVLLDQRAAHSEQETGRLKHAGGKDSHIILAPQPSEDPNDPLNWSFFKKHLVLFIIFLGTIIHGVVPSPLLNAGIVIISTQLNRTVTDIAKLSGYLMLATGASGPFVSGLGRKYGKRPLYVFSSFLGTVGIIICEVASTYNTLLAGRILQGIAVTAYESLAIASIGDLFFVHERGSRVAMMMFLLTSISNGVSIIAGVITANLGWSYNFHICIPFAALQLILVVFFCPETMYRRSHIYDIDTAGSEEDLEKLASVEARAAHHVENHNRVAAEISAATSTDLEKTTSKVSKATTSESIPAKKSFLQELSLYNGVFVEDSVVKMALASIAILLNIGACYQVLATGLIIAWYVAIAITSGVIFASPLYLLSAAGVGYMSAGPLIGGFLASVVAFFVSEPLIRILARRNKGVYEPEFCLLPILLCALPVVGGLVGWGYAVENFVSVYVVCFIWGLILFGITLVATFATQWALDAYRQNSTEVFVMNMVFKNFFYYGLTNYVIDWYLTHGAVQVVGVMAGITGAFALLAVPLYVYGKKYRYFWHHHNALKWLHLETDHAGTE